MESTVEGSSETGVRPTSSPSCFPSSRVTTGSRHSLARGRATHWSERDLETIETAEQALALAGDLAAAELDRPGER
jgi:hypothetical protein